MDLLEVRSVAFKIILELGHIPVCLESSEIGADYTADKYVAKYIDASQYVILIIGSRYGNLSSNKDYDENPGQGLVLYEEIEQEEKDLKEEKNYVEEEYDYAISKGKPILCFINKDYKKSGNRKLIGFVDKILKNHVVAFWDSLEDFKSRLALSVSEVIHNTPSSTYWKRSSSPLDGENSDYLDGLGSLLNNKSNEKDLDILGLMLYNLKEIREFYTLAKNQAKKSFYLAVGMCIAGFMLFAASSACVLIWKESLFALLSALGGVVVEIIAGTSLFVYKRSLLQLNYYYTSLHDNERFLSLINIASKEKEEHLHGVLIYHIVTSELERFQLQDKAKGNTEKNE